MEKNFTSEQTATEINKLMSIAGDAALSADLRSRAIKSLGNIGSHDALLGLLELVADDRNSTKERELALKEAQSIVKRGR